MVRLEVQNSGSQTVTTRKFQFQNGAIRRTEGILDDMQINGFNSKMVRLEAQPFAIISLLGERVSIPKWCD
jgi:hypothetical protein